MRSVAAFLTACALPALLSGTASAEGWTIGGVFSQDLRVDDGGLRGGDNRDKTLIESATDFIARFQTETARSQLTLSPGVRFVANNDQDAELRDLRPRFNGAYGLRGDDTNFTLNGSVVPRLATDAQFDDTGVDETDVVQIDTSLRAALGYTLDPANRLSFGANGRLRTFSEETDSLTNNSSVGGTFGWSASVNRDTTANFNSSIRHFDTPGRSSGQSFTLTAGFAQIISEALSVNAAVGPSFLRRNDERDDSRSNAIGLSFDAGASYDLSDTLTAALNLSQDFDQDSNGDFENTARLGLRLRYRINDTESVSLSATSTLQNPAFDSDSQSRQNLSLSPRYTIALTDAWDLGIGYRLRVRRDDDDTRSSNSVFVEISRGISFLP